MLDMATGHATLRAWSGDGIDASGNATPDLASAAVSPGGGRLTEMRISHARAGMYTYKIEIILPDVGQTLSSLKPAPLPGWNLRYNPSSSASTETRKKITYTAYLGHELFDQWYLQIPISMNFKCNTQYNDPLIRGCGSIEQDMIMYALFPVRQHLCEVDANGVCVPNGQTLDWADFAEPPSNATKLSDSCNAKSSPGIKVFRSPRVRATCNVSVTTPQPAFALSTAFESPCTGESCNSGVRAASPASTTVIANGGTTASTATSSSGSEHVHSLVNRWTIASLIMPSLVYMERLAKSMFE